MNKDVTAYLADVPAERQSHVTQLHELIVGLYPNATVDMSYRMPTYRVGEGWVALANQKRYVSLYTCGEVHLAAFKKKHPDIKTGKGCINFKESDRLPITALKQVVRHAIEHPKG
ncbi:MAG: DUF1801 domain-containing protein [Planctomycetota bacterium]|nr:MAG: DUF1801 domain-containing protein [Planctomycetota bacterium]REJ95403.1 MAG: DUF1801 domain-containing protein [Planctomycetota bacterium]REK46052.1 MAG: DUF1801 domain-containing protein [Planctomycetota bacterium]